MNIKICKSIDKKYLSRVSQTVYAWSAPLTVSENIYRLFQETASASSFCLAVPTSVRHTAGATD